jgi:EAL domain-containing protein (putative c-di-GMP-specific phosphodiesterase class I)
VLSETLVEWARWRAQGRCLDLSVNMSVRNLLNRTLLSRVADTIRASPAADHLLLEVTETAVMIDPKETRRGLAALRTLGVRVSMDDFGAGYSSLTQLGQLPVDELKIDRQLVQGIAASELNNALVETIVALGHRLGLVVVAEGIETQSTLDVARQLGCDFAQGYLISRPVPGHELLTRIEHGLSHLGG